MEAPIEMLEGKWWQHTVTFCNGLAAAAQADQSLIRLL